MIHIREFQNTTQDYNALAGIVNAVWPEAEYSVADLKRLDNQRPSKCTHHRYLAQEHGRIVAQGSIENNHKFFHPQHFWMRLDVLQDRRQQGIGGQLYEHMLAQLRSKNDPTAVYTNTTESRAGSVSFLKQRNFQVIKRDPKSRLEVRQFDLRRFQELQTKIAAMGIKIRTLSDLLQNDKEALFKLYNLHQLLVNDVPEPGMRTRVDFKSWRKGYSSANPYLIPAAHFIALAGAEYIGVTSLWGDPAADRLFTGLTGVKRAHRRHGLATALKLQTIAYAQAHGISQILTSNNDENPMYQLNLKLGFETYDVDLKLVNKL